ncbi:hypothetical protein EGW08_011919 [Elysia chlorotica]|uniref:Uncharacterized protein n=1 Tax=Elysia chlorotica TaxID=188477 RepID=A0A433TFF9_ELYCH|nr:hypothetical protein EGW08_011919 [Elysia chlorotica]
MLSPPAAGKTDVKITKIRHSPLPIGLKAVKSSAYGAFSRQFVNFTLESQLAKDVLEWSKDIYSPDEMYWGILNYNHAEPAPGGFLGNVSENPWLSSYSEWAFAKGSMKRCLSKFVRGVCIFSPADLPMLVRKPNFFANKFHITHQPAALHCLDQWIFNKTFSLNIIDEKMYLAYLKKRFYVKSSYSEAFKLPV